MKTYIKKVKQNIEKHPIIAHILISVIVSLILAVPISAFQTVKEIFSYGHKANAFELISTFFMYIFVLLIVLTIIIYPFFFTLYEIIRLVATVKNRGIEIKGLENIDVLNKVFSMLYDIFALFIGVILEIVILDLMHDVVFGAQWNEQLTNSQLHTPLNTDYIATFMVVLIMYVVGMLVLTLLEDNKRPPLVTVLCISSMYLGTIEAILFTIQILGIHDVLQNGNSYFKFTPDLLFVLLIPLNMVLILLRIMFAKIEAYTPDENRLSKIERVPFLSFCAKVLSDSKNWPILAAVMMIPLLGVVISILVLFGQAPDAAIKAFTETANYTFSTKIPPQNVFYDEHYLCTVAAGGHRKIVKPIRMGKRHGHDVVVNRQLMIANAFEQILEEKVPRLHRKIRNFYDKYGFPVARLIKTKLAADIVWFVMKPLEWMFLIVIYLTDVNPEDRIARQYL